MSHSIGVSEKKLYCFLAESKINVKEIEENNEIMQSKKSKNHLYTDQVEKKFQNCPHVPYRNSDYFSDYNG